MKALIAILAFCCMIPVAQAHDDDDDNRSTTSGTVCIVVQGEQICD